MRILALTHEQRNHFSMEPGFFEVLRPLAACQARHELFAYPYQRLTRSTDPADTKAANLDRILKDLKAISSLWQPDIVLNLLSWHNESVPPQLLHAIRESCCDNLVTIFFDHDETNRLLLSDEKGFFEASKLNLIADSPKRVERLRAGAGPYSGWCNRDSAHFVPLPIDKTVFRRIDESQVLMNRIGLMGSLEAHRAEVLKALQVRGRNVHTGGSLLDPGKYLEFEDYGRELGQSLANIVSTTQTYRSQIKGRSFQVIATGTCLVEEENDDNQDYFDPDYVWFWTGYDELDSQLETILSHPEDALARAREYSTIMEAKTDPDEWLKRVWGLL